MYKTAMLGCGGRARAHADAYRFVKNGKLAAICDMNTELLNSFGDDFGISSRYTDLDAMLEKEKPDVLHIVTAPVLRGSNERIRYPLMKQASDAGVPAAIVEKPIAVESEDWKQIAGLSKETKTKFVVNTQLNFHPQNLELKQDVAEGRIGDIKFIDASARRHTRRSGSTCIATRLFLYRQLPSRAGARSNLWCRTSGLSTTLSAICQCARPIRERASCLRCVWDSHRADCVRRSRLSFSTNVFSSLERTVSCIGDSVVGNAQPERRVMKGGRSATENRMSSHKATSPKPFLIGWTMRAKCIPPILNSHSQSSTYFWEFTIAG